MPDYCFFQKGQQTLVLECADRGRAAQLTEQGYVKQFEEIDAANETDALTRFADIRKNNQIDRSNFLAGAGQMPLIGVLTAAMTSLFRKR